jgi:hypothetical protein
MRESGTVTLKANVRAAEPDEPRIPAGAEGNAPAVGRPRELPDREITTPGEPGNWPRCSVIRGHVDQPEVCHPGGGIAGVDRSVAVTMLPPLGRLRIERREGDPPPVGRPGQAPHRRIGARQDAGAPARGLTTWTCGRPPWSARNASRLLSGDQRGDVPRVTRRLGGSCPPPGSASQIAVTNLSAAQSVSWTS